MESDLGPQTTETIAYPPHVHSASTITTNTVTDSARTMPEEKRTEVVQEHVQEIPFEEEDPAHGTLERLVKEEDIQHEIPAEDPDRDDGSQPMGIVESCFPYLSRRSHHHHHQSSSSPKGVLGCPGIRCYSVSAGYEDDSPQLKDEAIAVPGSGAILQGTSHAHKSEDISVKSSV